MAHTSSQIMNFLASVVKMERLSQNSSVVDVTHWKGEEESRIFPVGTREKKLIYCPAAAPYDFLEGGHRYLFKLSVKKCPEQFWIEVFAYHLGMKMGVEVPATFVAYDKKENQCGALIRWFLEEVMSHETPAMEKFESGGDLMQGYIANFDQKKGLQHNFATIAKQIFQEKYPQAEWMQHWAKTFLFDALIGNIDRHQDNWGIINGLHNAARITPVFDNGTSMGYEIKADRFHLYDETKLKKYVGKGVHHMKWDLQQDIRLQHAEFLQRYVTQYPETRQTMLDCLMKVDTEYFHEVFDDLMQFNLPVRLTEERAEFMLKLLSFRHKMLLNLLGS